MCLITGKSIFPEFIEIKKFEKRLFTNSSKILNYNMATTPNTHIANFNEGVSSFCIQNVLTPLCAWLSKEKNCTVSIDEMMTALNVQAPARQHGFPPAANVQIQMPQIPGLLAAGGAAATAAGGAGGSGRGKKVAAPTNGPTCQYVFIRGAKKNQMCAEPCIDGSQFCKSCIKKKAGGAGGGPAGTAAPSTPTAGGGGFVGVQGAQAAPATQNELQAVPIKDKPGCFKTIPDGFLIQQHANGSIIAIGIEVGGVVRTLNDSEKKRAEDLGIQIPDAQVGATVAAVPQVAQPAPQVATQAAPAAAALQINPPVAPNIPQIAPFPKIPPLGGNVNTIPAIPTISTIPQAK